jgi:hypothetical protein
MNTKRPDELTLDKTIDDLNRRGFAGHFGVIADGLREFGTGVTFRATEVRICECFRFERDSDPGEMAIVYAIETETGVRGTLIDALGVYSDPAISEFMTRVANGQPPNLAVLSGRLEDDDSATQATLVAAVDVSRRSSRVTPSASGLAARSLLHGGEPSGVRDGENPCSTRSRDPGSPPTPTKSGGRTRSGALRRALCRISRKE